MNPKKDIKIFIKLASEEDTEKIYNLMNNSFKSPDSSVNYRDLYSGERISYQEIKSIIESKTTDFILFFNRDNNDLISCESAELRSESNILFLGNKCVSTNCQSNYLSVLTTLDTMLLYKALILKKKIEKSNNQNNKYDKYNKYVDEVIEYFSIKYDFNNENISKMKIYNCSNLCDVVEYNSVIIKGYGDRIAKSLGFKFVKEVTYNKNNPPLGMKDLLKDVTVVFVKIDIFDNFNFDESTYMLNKFKFENRMIKNDYYNKQLAAEYPKNFFLEDELLQKYYQNFIFQDSENEKNKKEMEIFILEDLNNFGKKCNQKYINLAKEAEIFKPVLYKYDSYGNEINSIITTGAWKELKIEGCIEKISTMQYMKDDKYFQIPDYKLRILQMIKVYLLSPVSGMSTCPLSMTDGAIYLLKYIQGTNPEYFNDLMKESLISLLSGNCDKFFYSGQWMTEILGGSDVRNSTKTVAIYNEKYSEKKSLKYNLYGLKWFTSAIDADISFTLAKIYDPITNKVDDLPTLFFVKVNNNYISVNKLKDKMGTRQLPTAELLLKGTVGYMCSNRGKGISYIMKLANITRLHNITCSVGYMRGILFLLKDYSTKRFSFGKPLINHDLHKTVLDKLQFILEGCLILVLKLSYFTGKSYESFNHINFNDSKLAHTNNPVKLEFYEKYVFYENLLRMLLPICKMYCGRASELFCIESIQSLGAVGYMEDSFIPGLLRDTMATSIWEGSFNTLSIEFFKQYSNKDMIKILNNFLIQDVKNMDLLDLIKEITKFVIEIPNSFQTEASFLMCELTITKLISVHDDKDLKLLTFWSNKCKGSLFSLKQNVLKNPKF